MFYAANPITCLWVDLIEQGLTHNPKDAIYICTLFVEGAPENSKFLGEW